jgi:hypothetical protein
MWIAEFRTETYQGWTQIVKPYQSIKTLQSCLKSIIRLIRINYS